MRRFSTLAAATVAAATVALNCWLFASQPFAAGRLNAATIQGDGALF